MKCVLASGQLISVDRQAGKKDGPVIRTESTENQGQSYLDSLLGYATKEVFLKIFMHLLSMNYMTYKVCGVKKLRAVSMVWGWG